MAPLTQNMRDLFAKFTTTEDSTSQRFGSTGAYIHVGSSTSAFNSNQNSMLGTSTDGSAKGMNSGFPKRNDGTLSTAPNILYYQATFTTSEANHPWEEWGIANASATTTSTSTKQLMNRVAGAALGTKANTQAWQFSATITVST